MNEKIKKVLFEMSDTEYARFRIKLKHDKIKQKEFFCYLVRRYLENDHNVVEVVQMLQLCKSVPIILKILTKNHLKN